MQFSRWMALGLALTCALCWSQTTQGLIAGRIVNARTGRPIDHAKVIYNGRDGSIGGEQLADPAGYFTLPLLSPGFYHLRIEAPNFQPQEIADVELAVSGRLDFNFQLRPLSDVWEKGLYNSSVLAGTNTIVTFFGPDVDPNKTGSFEAPRGDESSLDASMSAVIDQQLIMNLPLDGRDVYALLALQPGVTADSTTGRGLGLAVVGQRTSESNFLLDGLQNNNSIITGPLQPLVPEAVEEYRISTNNYSAEYGATSGFIANAITRSASTRWHVLFYDYQQSDALNANGWQENASAFPRQPEKQTEPGVAIGGPILKNRWFISGVFDLTRYRTKSDPENITVPTTGYLATITGATAKALFAQYAPPVADLQQTIANIVVQPPVAINSFLIAPRTDYLRRDGADRFLFRAAVNQNNQPDFGWTPYPAFVTPLTQGANSGAGAWLRAINASLTNELRAGFSTDQVGFNRPNPQVPIMDSGDGAILPGSPELYSFEDRGRSYELVDNVMWTHGRHVFTFGGGFLLRTLSGYVTAGQDGIYDFIDLQSLASDQAYLLFIARTRQNPALNASPDYNRDYRYQQFYFFGQDSFRITPRLTVNFGIRYENLGAPVNTGSTKDALVQLGAGNSFVQRIANASIVYPGPGNEQLYADDNHDFAFRAGFAYSVRRDSRIVLRGGFGTFYTRPFDNLWLTMQANNILLANSIPGQTVKFQLPALSAAGATTLETTPGFSFSQVTQPLTFFQGNLRNGYAENGFLSLEERISEHFSIQTNAVMSLGRDLLTSDIVNRPLSSPTSTALFGVANGALPLLTYRGNQGFSDYYGGQLVARYRSPRLQLQASYTLSHAIDNQSDPLAQAFLNFSFVNPANGVGPAAFTQQFNSQGDRANADFDQRSNFVVYAVWEPPPIFTSTRAARVFRDWTIGWVAAIRSGFPYSPLAPSLFNGSGQFYFNNRADLVPGVPLYLNQAAPGVGGVQILNPAAFTTPGPGQLSNIGRNEFRGPGLYSTDVSLARHFPLARLGETGRLTVRADAFNLLNHANLNMPCTIVGGCANGQNFGVAQYGLQSTDTSGFPASSPFQELPRVIQLAVRIEF